MMPRMDGLEFCRRLRATRHGQLVPFIFLTAKKDLEDRLEGHYIGADDYVTKPFEPLELLAKIEAQIVQCIRPIIICYGKLRTIRTISPSRKSRTNRRSTIDSGESTGVLGSDPRLD
jgi:DNA-binding response OmpR family regulator